MLKEKIQESKKIPYRSIKKTTIVVGIDEVGRGAIAGKLYIGYSILHNSHKVFPLFCHHYVNANQATINESDTEFKRYANLPHSCTSIRDSKKLSNRSALLSTVLDELSINQKNESFQLSYVTIDALTIDKYSMGACLRHGVHCIVRLIEHQYPKEEIVILADGLLTFPLSLDTTLIDSIIDQNNLISHKELLKKNAQFPDTIMYYNCIKGDDIYFAVALISLYIKVARDSEMKELHTLYPHFGWDQNNGYGTKKQRDAIVCYGKKCPILRQSFLSRM